MNLYEFVLNTYGKTKIIKKVLESTEHPKTYSVFDGRWTSRRVNKRDIGIVSGWSANTVILLVDDMEKAKEIFVEDLKRRISDEKESIKAKIKSGNERISNLEKAIEEIKESEE